MLRAALALLLLAAAPADACHRCRPRRVACVAPAVAYPVLVAPPVVTTVAPVVTAPTPPPVVPPVVPSLSRDAATAPAAVADPYGFVSWLNSARAARGLAPVAWDADLVADAARNSLQGYAHSHYGRARRQNVGVGSLHAVETAWLLSPPHASALLDPSIAAVGLAHVGGIWTYSAR